MTSNSNSRDKIPVLSGEDRHLLYEEIHSKMREFVNQILDEVHPEDEYLIRERLNDEFRFWR